MQLAVLGAAAGLPAALRWCRRVVLVVLLQPVYLQRDMQHCSREAAEVGPSGDPAYRVRTRRCDA